MLVVVLIILVGVLAGLFYLKGLSGKEDEDMLSWLSRLLTGGDGNFPDLLGDGNGGLGGLPDIFGGRQSKTVMRADRSGQETFSIPNATPAWSDDGQKVIFNASGHRWSVNLDGTGLTKLTDHEKSKRETMLGGTIWHTGPRNDPFSSKIVYLAYAGKELEGDYYYYDSVNLDGTNTEKYAVVKCTDTHECGFTISEQGNLVLAAGGYMITDFTLGEFVDWQGKEKLDLPYGHLNADGSGYIFVDSMTSINRINIPSGDREYLMDADCYQTDYCSEKNLLVCSNSGADSTASCTKIFIYNLNDKTSKQIYCEPDFQATNFKFSPDCSKIAYRAYNHSQGPMLKVLDVS